MKITTQRKIKEILEEFQILKRINHNFTEDELITFLGRVSHEVMTDLEVMLDNAKVGDLVTDDIHNGQLWEIKERFNGWGMEQHDFVMINKTTGEETTRFSERFIGKDLVKVTILPHEKTFIY